LRLWKAHALGNDYLVLEEGGPLDAAMVRTLCARHTGVGADGVLEPVAPEHDADRGVRIWNPDGSVAERSGNGLRIFAQWLADRGPAHLFRVSTAGDVVTCEVGADRVSVHMPPARVGAAEALDLGGVDLVFVPVDVGNPHAVVWRDELDLDAVPWRQWGAATEVHPRFAPHRTNVQFARVTGSELVEVRVWERGAGATASSGTSACAVAASAVATGRATSGRIRVTMPGGQLWVTVRDDVLVLEGPVTPVGRIEVDPRFFRA
jgi:diaminopimelate epimerase